MDDFYTIGDLARYFGVRVSVVDYAIRSRSVPESARVGVTRMWDGTARELVGEALVSVASKGLGRPAGA